MRPDAEQEDLWVGKRVSMKPSSSPFGEEDEAETFNE